MRNRDRQSASGIWARADRRVRWRALTVIAIVAAVTGGVALASLSGARRTHSAFDRLRTRTNAADAIVFPSQVGKFHPEWSKLRARPEVDSLAVWFLTFGTAPGEPDEVVLFGSVDGAWGTTIDKPIIKQGRMYDVNAPDEMVVDEEAAKSENIHVGDVFPFHAYGPKQDDTAGDPPSGAEIQLRVVGIVRTTPQFLFTSLTMLSPGVLKAHGDDMLWIENGFVRLRPGGGGVAALQRDANELVAPGAPVLDLLAARRRVDTTTDVEQSFLIGIGIAIAAAGLVLVGQMLSRSASTIRADAPVLRAFGMSKRDLASAGAQSHLFVAIGGGIGALVTAVIASRWFPVGIAGRVDPDRGVHVDWLVFGAGAVLVAVLLFGGAYLIAGRAARRESAARPGARNALLGSVRRNTPVTVGVGATMAFDQRQRGIDVAVRPAVIGAIVGVLGVVGALTIDHGLRDTLAHPERAGVTWDASVAPNAGDYATRGLKPELTARVASVPGVRSVTTVDRLVVDVNGVGVPGFTLRSSAAHDDAATFTMISGHAPETADQAAIGPATEHDADVHVGDVVTVGPNKHRVQITGQALFPTDVHANIDQGVWLTPAGWDAAVPPNDLSSEDLESLSGRAESVLAVRFASGVDHEEGVATLTSALGNDVAAVAPAEQPAELLNLRNVKRLPQVLAAFLALLAVAALTYLLVALSRALARDFAVLRAIGFTRGQSRVVVGVQSTAISIVGLLLGIPLGMLLGRLAWRLIAERVPLQDVAPVAAIALVLIVPLALLAANLLAAWPANRVARLRVAEVLRTE